MGKIKQPSKAALFAAIMYSDEKIAKKAVELLVKKFSKISFESEEYEFKITDFYEEEFGKDLKKKFFLFEKNIDRESLAEIKIFSNKLEENLAKNSKRTVNIDPGYITQANVVLASCKEFPHRIYIGKGIHSEVEMMFKKDRIEYPQYVYKDYQTEIAKKFFMDARKELMKEFMLEKTCK